MSRWCGFFVYLLTLLPLSPPSCLPSPAPPTPTLAQVRAAFAEARDATFVDVDASGSVDAVHARVLAEAAEAVRRCREGQPIRTLWDGAPLAPGL